MNREVAQVLSSLQTLCSKREYCSADIYLKALKALDGDEQSARQVCASLQEDRFVDDARYAAAFAREKASLSGWGPVKIRHALRFKGIGRRQADAALEEVDSERAGKKMLAVLKAKYSVLEGDPHAKFKLLKFGLSRGYEYDVLQPAVEEIIGPSRL